MASSSASRSDPSEESSFVKMDEKDPSLIGAHCQYTYCNQLDFLPFRCESCRGTFCLDHRSETGHRCPKAGEWAARRRKANLDTPSLGAGKSMAEVQKPCESPKCSTIIGTSLSISVHCSTCNRDYCLKHRLTEDHDCKNLVPIGARVKPFGGEAEKARLAFGRLKAWGTAQKANVQRSLPKPKPSSAAARLVAVNNLKKTAKGDSKLQPEKRVYLSVEAEAATTTAKFPSGGFFYSKDWVIGRVLDAAAKSLQVQNVNNQGMDEKDKLRVFHIEGGRLLEFNEKVGDTLISGNKIVLLRGIGPSVPDLIEL
jgi:predicted nucleic acid binding AN1-type Zn finger protein